MKKIGLICLALVLALGTLGVGYALWSEDLYIDATINTGDVDAEWSVEAWGADGDWKEVSDITWEIVNDGHTLLITITNAYPSVWYWVLFDIHCTGSIPIHVGEFIVDRGNLPAGAYLDVYYDGPWQLHYCEEGYGLIDLHLDNDAEENTTYTFSVDVTVGQYNEFPPGGGG